VLALAITTLAQTATASPTVAPDAGKPTAVRVAAGHRALARLTSDSRGAVRVTRGDEGVARVVGVTGAHNPAVTRATSARAAARAHLSRYGALVGVADPRTQLVGGPVTRSVTGHTVVRFSQRRYGLPVIGGAVVVDLRVDRQLGSVTASVSRATVPGATYPRGAAKREALAVASRHLVGGTPAALWADRPGRRLYDPAVLGVRRTSDPTTEARGVWWVEVHAGPAFHRLVLVDDRTGAVVQDLDLVEHLDRVVCDNKNFNTEPEVACTHNFARTEHGPASGVKDVNDAFRLAGVVSTFYHQIGRIHLTRLLGVDEGGHLSLSSTVRWCDPGARPENCPLKNAFWNGAGMFYGQGFASADDVVGHEMTHGVISHNADLFYWGQSGAINESLADIMGEIIDHRHPSPGDSPHNWALGEDLPIGAVRNMKNPGKFRQPEMMTSRRYARGEFDNGGVHINSGVGNRTFYLISQGGKQGGEHVRGIDGPSLKKSATLYLDVIQHLVSGSDYADLAAVLDRSCHALARHHTVGMTAANCRNVHRATLATRLRTTPPRAKQPPDARMACPKGDGPVRVLFDSEKGKPRSKFDAGSAWLRAPNLIAFPPVAANAISGHTSWHSYDLNDFTVSSLRMRPVALPAGRAAYLWFQQWRVIDSATNADGHKVNYDAGTVEVADATRGRAPKPAEGMSWVNGPRDRITKISGNPSAGRVGFSRDSHGYLASRLKLTRYAGHAMSPQFTMNTDDVGAEPGWYLDDIRVYTCSRAPVPKSTPRITGAPTVGTGLTANAGRWSPSDAKKRLQWYADGHAIAGATGTSYVVRDADLGQRLSVKVTARSHGRHASTFSAATAPVTSV
jgi:Zn-dependent metalloprotease